VHLPFGPGTPDTTPPTVVSEVDSLIATKVGYVAVGAMDSVWGDRSAATHETWIGGDGVAWTPSCPRPGDPGWTSRPAWSPTDRPV